MGIEPSALSTESCQLPDEGGAESGALAPSDPVAALLSAVRALSDEQRARLVTLLSAPGPKNHLRNRLAR